MESKITDKRGSFTIEGMTHAPTLQNSTLRRINSKDKPNFQFNSTTGSGSVWDMNSTNQKRVKNNVAQPNDSQKQFSVTSRKLRSLKAQQVVFDAGEGSSPILSRLNTHDEAS